MMKYILIPLLTLIFSACAFKSENPDIQKMYDEVMFIHDEVMPEMSTIHRLKKQIRNQESLDSLSLGLIKELEDADEAMMDWMARFKPDKKADEKDQLAYLLSEKEKISAVSNQMKTIINKAKTYVQAE